MNVRLNAINRSTGRGLGRNWWLIVINLEIGCVAKEIYSTYLDPFNRQAGALAQVGQ